MNNSFVTIEGNGLIPCTNLDFWNGWACPEFDSENLKIAVDVVNGLSGHNPDFRVWIDEENQVVKSLNDGELDEPTPISDNGTCALGAWSWTWTLFDVQEFLDSLSDSARENFDALKKEYAHRLQREISDGQYLSDLVNDYGVDIYDVEDFQLYLDINVAMLMHVCDCEVDHV